MFTTSLRLRRRFRINLRAGVLISGLAVLGLVGLQSLQAASTTTEAEALTLPASAGKVFADAGASGGNALMIWSNAAATGQVSTPTTSKITVRAKGDQCNGGPQMVVKIDGATVLTSTVASAWTDYAAAVTIPAGTHAVSVAFTNDAKTSTCDRNLRVDKITFTEASLTPTPTMEAESMSLTPGAGQVFADSAASGGQGLLVWSNGTASSQVTTPEASRIIVRARGDQCAGAAGMIVKLDNVQVLSAGVIDSTWTDYGVNVAVPAGSHQISISFTNDAKTATCDRNLRLDKVSFTTSVSNPPPPIEPSPIPPPPPPPVGGGTTIPGTWNTYQGLNFTGWCTDCWNTPTANTSFNNMAAMGGNSVTFPVYLYQDTKYSTTIHHSRNTTSDAALIQKIQQAKAKGLKVMLRPIIDTENNGGWRGAYQPSSQATWFNNYRLVINHYAVMAQAQGVDILEIGSEFNSLQGNAAEWRRVAAQVRSQYAGKITYSGNHDAFAKVTWYDAVDLISVDAYFPLAKASEGVLSEDTIIARWNSYNGRSVMGEIAAVQAKFGKPVIFGEMGYGSRIGALENPWAVGGTYSAAQQQNALNAAFRAFDNKPWFQGMFVWHWSYNPEAGGLGNTDHTPQRKPAADTVRNRFMAS